MERMEIKDADEITEMMLNNILEDEAYTRVVREWDEEKEDWADVELTDPPFKPGDNFIVFVNGMGGTPVSELYIIYRKVAEMLEDKGYGIARNLVGSYITSLEMAGMSITLLKATDEMLELWDAPVNTPGLRWGV
jgi:dihydroxyacetone kinase-like protein